MNRRIFSAIRFFDYFDIWISQDKIPRKKMACPSSYGVEKTMRRKLSWLFGVNKVDSDDIDVMSQRVGPKKNSGYHRQL